MTQFSILEQHCQSGRFHHGYFLVGKREVMKRAALKAAAAILGSQPENHPDFFEFEAGRLSIDESRKIKQQAYLRPKEARAKVFLVLADSFTGEAENALLKLLEEPPEAAYFFVVAPRREALSPVSRSRLTVVQNRQKDALSQEKTKFLTNFLKVHPQKRLEMVKTISQDRKRTSEFLKALDSVLLPAVKSAGFKSELLPSIVKDIELSRRLSLHPALSGKLILEHLALSLPRLLI